jgi:hypothetical protein
MDCKVTHSFVFQPKAAPFFNLHFRPEYQSERKKNTFSFIFTISFHKNTPIYYILSKTRKPHWENTKNLCIFAGKNQIH